MMSNRGQEHLKREWSWLPECKEWTRKICIFSICVVPMVAMLAVTMSIIFQRTSNHVNNEKVGQAIKFSIAASDVVHYLQIERDMTASYQSSFTQVTKTNLVKHYLLTDAALDRMSTWPVAEDELRAGFKTKYDFLIYLNQYRYEQNASHAMVKIEVESYTAIIDQLDAWFSRAVLKAKSVSTWKELVALQHMFDAKKAFATEMAYGALFFINGGFSVFEYVAFAQSRAVVNISLESAVAYSDIVRDSYIDYREKNITVTNQMTTMRNYIFNRNAFSGMIGEPSRQLALWWFHNATDFMNELFNVGSTVKLYIADKANKSYRSDTIGIIIISIAFCILTPFCFLMGNAVLQQLANKNKMEFYAVKSSQVLKGVDSLGNRAMCYVINSRLWDGGVASKVMSSGCRPLPQVSILVAEVVGIPSQLSKRNFKMAANVMKAFDKCLDAVALKHNVIQKKDGYTVMVASGVATSYYDHASHLVQFAADLLHKVKALPLINNHRLHIRIGINSGTVEAGVIELTTDVYLGYFSGRSVSTAESVASSSKVEGILVTNNTYQLLMYHDSMMERVEETVVDTEEAWGPNYWVHAQKWDASKTSGFSRTVSGTSIVNAGKTDPNLAKRVNDMVVYDIE